MPNAGYGRAGEAAEANADCRLVHTDLDRVERTRDHAERRLWARAG